MWVLKIPMCLILISRPVVSLALTHGVFGTPYAEPGGEVILTVHLILSVVIPCMYS